MARTKKQIEFMAYQNDASVHTRKRLAQRYPTIYRDISLKDLRNAPSIHLCNAQGPCRIIFAVLVVDTIVYVVKSQHLAIVHTVLTEAMVTERLEELGIESTSLDESVREALTARYKSYSKYIEGRR